MDFHVRDFYGTERTLSVRSHARDFLYQFNGGVITLAENGVTAVQAGVGNFGDEKLRAVGVVCGIGIGETVGTIESEGGRSLILESVARIARTGAGGISTLNHETGDHAVEDGAVIKRNAVLLGVRDGAGPVLGAGGQADEIIDSNRGDLRKQRAMEVASCGVDDGGGLRGGSGSGTGGLANGRLLPCPRPAGWGSPWGPPPGTWAFPDPPLPYSPPSCSLSAFFPVFY